jgi:hypothetical protein
LSGKAANNQARNRYAHSQAMKPQLDIIDRIKGAPILRLASAFRDLATWTSWLAWLKAIFALLMDDAELAIFRKCTGRRYPQTIEPAEAYTIVGRHGGKSFISALTAVHVGYFRDYRPFLNAGETATVMNLARDRDPAKIVFATSRESSIRFRRSPR